MRLESQYPSFIQASLFSKLINHSIHITLTHPSLPRNIILILYMTRIQPSSPQSCLLLHHRFSRSLEIPSHLTCRDFKNRKPIKFNTKSSGCAETYKRWLQRPIKYAACLRPLPSSYPRGEAPRRGRSSLSEFLSRGKNRSWKQPKQKAVNKWREKEIAG